MCIIKEKQLVDIDFKEKEIIIVYGEEKLKRVFFKKFM